jgi:hypothetical protein
MDENLGFIQLYICNPLTLGFIELYFSNLLSISLILLQASVRGIAMARVSAFQMGSANVKMVTLASTALLVM